MPTSAQTTWSNQKLEPYLYPEDARTMSVKLAPNLSLAKGTVLGQITASGLYKAYANANADGSEVARAILPYDVQTDASGKVTLSATANQAGGEHGQKYDSINVYVAGWFKTNELVGLDAAAVADLGRLVLGSVTDGILRMP